MIRTIFRLRSFALLAGLLLASACGAATDTPNYVEGEQYVALPAPHQRYNDQGKVEVVEVFSYGCPHCAHFAPYAEQLRKSLPAGAVFKLMPAAFDSRWEPFARAYYAAEDLGVAKQTHLELFREKFEQHYPINTLDELADFYARNGVDRAKFLKTATSPKVDAQLRKADGLIRAWGVDGTPSIVVDGAYRSANIHSFDELVGVARWLAQRELAGKK